MREKVRVFEQQLRKKVQLIKRWQINRLTIFWDTLNLDRKPWTIANKEENDS
jgi:hypothetical protein